MKTLAKKLHNLSILEYKKYLKTQDTDTLESLKEYLDDIYHNSGEALMDDDRYDILVNILQAKGNVSSKVGAKLRTDSNRVDLPYWLGSADKITPEDVDVLDRWISKHTSPSYVVTDKLDGVSCLFVRKNGKNSLYTRGDGNIGADISYLSSYFSLPKLSQSIAVRGELIIPKGVFNSKYRGKEVAGRTYKNARNMVAGLIGAKTARQGLEDIRFITYEIVTEEAEKPEAQLYKLGKLGFSVVRYEVVKKISMDKLTDMLKDAKKNSPYEVDGIIIQANKEYVRNTDGNPEYLFAFKMLFDEAIHTAIIKDIEWNVSKWGQLKPVAIINPIDLGDVTISRATAHNAKYVEENNLGPDAVIKITRSKDVIPYILEVTVQAEEPKMPTVPYSWDKTHVNISVKKHDSIMCVKLIADFFQKLGIKFVSEATVQKLYDNGFDNLLKIIEADKKALLRVPEFQEKSAERIYTNIRNGLQGISIPTVIGASGVLGYGIGRKRVESLMKAIPNLLEVYKTKSKKQMVDMIVSVEGFSNITAEKIAENLKYADRFIKKLSKYATFKSGKKISSALSGKYVFSGFRDKKLEEDITSRGGAVTTSVSKNTTAVIVTNLSSTSGKTEKARELGLPVYEKNDFIKQFII
jgi:NAD-dependent DNA ligase